MDALVPAFVAALMAGVGDRPARLAALLGRHRAAVAGLILGHAIAIAIGVASAYVIAPLLAPNARSLLLAIALVLAGVAGLWRRRSLPSSRDNFFAAAAHSFVTGDGLAFLTFALSAWGSAPVLAGIGALAAAVVLAASAAAAGRAWERAPLTVVGRVAGGVLVVAGLIVALGALRLV